MSEFKTTGLVLKANNYAEADRIYRIFTQEFGLISALGKGVKKLTSKKSGALEIFHVVQLRLHRRMGELFLVTGATPVSTNNRQLTTDNSQLVTRDFRLPNLAVSYECAEWLLALLPPEKPFPEAYALVLEIFSALTQTPKNKLLVLTFKTKLLNLLGYFREHEEDTRTHKLLRFLALAKLPEILRVAADAETFARAEKILDEIFLSVTEKESRVGRVVGDW